jgi:hypothetical protein
MNGQGDLLDFAAAIAARDEAVTRVGAHADVDWVAHILDVIYCLAVAQEEITTDDVWATVGEVAATHEPRALGAVMRQAARLGYLRVTDRYVPSARAACHARPVRVWESLIRPGAA